MDKLNNIKFADIFHTFFVKSVDFYHLNLKCKLKEYGGM